MPISIIDPRITLLLQLFGQNTEALIPLLQTGTEALAAFRGAKTDAERVSTIANLAAAALSVQGAVRDASNPQTAGQIEEALHEIANDDAKANKVFDNTAGPR